MATLMSESGAGLLEQQQLSDEGEAVSVRPCGCMSVCVSAYKWLKASLSRHVSFQFNSVVTQSALWTGGVYNLYPHTVGENGGRRWGFKLQRQWNVVEQGNLATD